MTALKPSDYVKLRVMVPLDSADAIRRTLAAAGAGVQGRYTHCSGSQRQIGRFKPGAGAAPAIGQVGVLTEVEEEVIETICHQDKVAAALKAVRAVHPYEEPAIDILPRLELE